MLGAALQTLLDLCFPPRCAACGAEDWDASRGLVCRACARHLPGPGLRCPACGRLVGPHEVGPGCARCAGLGAERDALRWSGTPAGAARRALRGVIAAWPYAATARDLVLGLKFHGRPEAATALGRGLAEAVWRARVPGDLIVPVPLSPRRRRTRGYNQAVLLAAALARSTRLEVCPRALRRRRHGPPQTGLSRSARRRGPRGAFVARPRLVRERCVILVDDVLTTGATARACAVALRHAGARAVTAAVACRTERR